MISPCTSRPSRIGTPSPPFSSARAGAKVATSASAPSPTSQPSPPPGSTCCAAHSRCCCSRTSTLTHHHRPRPLGSGDAQREGAPQEGTRNDSGRPAAAQLLHLDDPPRHPLPPQGRPRCPRLRPQHRSHAPAALRLGTGPVVPNELHPLEALFSFSISQLSRFHRGELPIRACGTTACRI